MDANVNKCTKCKENNSKRRCHDCVFPTNEFCEKCFKEYHSGISTRNHLSKDMKYNAFIIDNFVTDKSNINLPPDINDLSSNEKAFSSFIPEPHVLFENGSIKSFDSVKEFTQSLLIKESSENIDFQIVTFISQPIDTVPLPNLLLLDENDIKFNNGKNITSNPICIIIYDLKNRLLILETQGMQKQNPHYYDNQLKLMNLILALSDIIVFSENKRPRDYIRIHEMMKRCKDRHNFRFQKINKYQPEKLAPALIYLQSSEVISNDLSTSIKDSIDRNDLFASFTKIIHVNNNFKNNQDFYYGLTEILQNVSQYRNCHTFEDLILCINNCKESPSENIPINEIPNKWFICNTSCEICKKSCRNYFGHSSNHYNEEACLFTPDNVVYFCKKCQETDNKKCMLPLVFKPMSKNDGFLKNLISYPIRGKIVECEEHGIILDKNWLITYYEETTYSKYLHKWPGESLLTQDVYPVGQVLIDKVNEMSKPVVKLVINSSEYVSDIVKPNDWQPVRGTFSCSCCQNLFTIRMSKHHCRICKNVICSSCCAPNQLPLICKQCHTNDICKSIQEEPRGITFLNVFRDVCTLSSYFVRSKLRSFVLLVC